MNNNITFTSSIKAVPLNVFAKARAALGEANFVRHPWTANETVVARGACTDQVWDCTSGAITDGQKVVMFHICPEMKENFNFDKVKEIILSKVDKTSEQLQGFLLGSVASMRFKDSESLFKKFQKLMKDEKIPYSMVRGNTERAGSTGLLYDSAKDEFIISNYGIDSAFRHGKTGTKEMLEKFFDEVNISKFDEII